MVISAQIHQQVSTQVRARRNAPCRNTLTADAVYRDCSAGAGTRHLDTRRGERNTIAKRVRPNPSLKLSPNGVSPSPVWRYAVHFRQSGLGATPLVPA